MFDFLYQNIGSKIKIWAKWIFIIEALGSIITGLSMLIASTDGDDYLFFWSLVPLCVGPIVAFVSTWILYAFGELVEDTHAIRNHLNPMTPKYDAQITNNLSTTCSTPAPIIQSKTANVDKNISTQPVVSTCELCGKTCNNLQRRRVNASVGWLDICDECVEKLNQES